MPDSLTPSEAGAVTADPAARARILEERQRRAGVRVTPLSGAQRGLWFLAKLDPAATDYLETIVVTIRGAVNQGALRAALCDLIGRQSNLHSRFASGRTGPLRLVPVDRRWVPPPTIEAQTGDLADQLNALGMLAPMNVDGMERLFRLRILRRDPATHVIALVVHHAIWDGASAEILLDELTAAYDRAWQPANPEIAPRPVTDYDTYVLAERHALTAPRLDDAQRYWREALASAPVYSPGFAPDATRAMALGVLTRPVAPDLREGIQRLARRTSSTVFAVGLAAFAAALRQRGTGDDLVIACPTSMRPHDHQYTIGLYVNLLLLRLRMTTGLTYHDLITAAVTARTAALRHAEVPFDEVIRALQPVRQGSETPYSQFMFEVNPGIPVRHTRDDVAWRVEWLNGTTPKCRVLLAWNETAEGVALRLEYNKRHVSDEEAALLAADVDRMLRAMTTDPAGRLNPPPVPAREPSTLRECSSVELAAQPLRRVLAELWCEVLGVTSLSDGDDFFELGGHSLAATRLVNRIAEQLHLEVPVRTLFDAESFASFVALVAVMGNTLGDAGGTPKGE